MIHQARPHMKGGAKLRRCPSTVSCTVPRCESVDFGGTQLTRQQPQRSSSKGISLSEYSGEKFRVRLRKVSEYGSVVLCQEILHN